MQFAPTLSPGLGFNIQNNDARMVLASGVAPVLKGQVLVVDTSVVDSTTLKPTTVKAPAAGDIAAGATLPIVSFFCVALEDQPTALGQLMCRFIGEVEALISGTPAANTAVMATTTRLLIAGTASAGAGTRLIAIMRQLGVDATLKKVFFDGIHGVGYANSST